VGRWVSKNRGKGATNRVRKKKIDRRWGRGYKSKKRGGGKKPHVMKKEGKVLRKTAKGGKKDTERGKKSLFWGAGDTKKLRPNGGRRVSKNKRRNRGKPAREGVTFEGNKSRKPKRRFLCNGREKRTET